MTLYVWMDEWKVTHFPPNDGSPAVQVLCTEPPVFLDDDTFEEIKVEIR